MSFPLTLTSTMADWLAPLTNTLQEEAVPFLAAIEYSQSAYDLVQWASTASNNVSLDLDSELPASEDGYYYSGKISLNLEYSPTEIALTLIHEITHARQDSDLSRNQLWNSAPSAAKANPDAFVVYAGSNEAYAYAAEYQVMVDWNNANYNPPPPSFLPLSEVPVPSTVNNAFIVQVQNAMEPLPPAGTLETAALIPTNPYYAYSVRYQLLWAEGTISDLLKSSAGTVVNLSGLISLRANPGNPSDWVIYIGDPSTNSYWSYSTYSPEMTSQNGRAYPWTYHGPGGLIEGFSSVTATQLVGGVSQSLFSSTPSSLTDFDMAMAVVTSNASGDPSVYNMSDVLESNPQDNGWSALSPNETLLITAGPIDALTVGTSSGSQVVSLTSGASVDFDPSLTETSLTFSSDASTGLITMNPNSGESIDAPTWNEVTVALNGAVNFNASPVATLLNQGFSAVIVSAGGGQTLTGTGSTAYFAQDGDTISDPNGQGKLYLPFQLASVTGDPVTKSMTFTGTNGQTVTVLNWFVPGNVPMQGGVVEPGNNNPVPANSFTVQALYQSASADGQTLVGFDGFNNVLATNNFANVTLVGPTSPGSSTQFYAGGNNTTVVGQGTVRGYPTSGTLTLDGAIQWTTGYAYGSPSVDNAVISQNGPDLTLSWGPDVGQVLIKNGAAGGATTAFTYGNLFFSTYSSDQLVDRMYLNELLAAGATGTWNGWTLPNGDTYVLPLGAGSFEDDPVYGDPTPIPVGNSPPFQLDGITAVATSLGGGSQVSNVSIAGVLQTQTITTGNGVIIKASPGSSGTVVNVYTATGQTLGTFTASSAPVSTTNPIDGSVTQTQLTAQGGLLVSTTLANGTVHSIQPESDGSVVSNTTNSAGVNISTNIVQPDGTSTTQYFAPDGTTVLSTRNETESGSYTINTVANDGTLFVSHYTRSGVLIEQDISAPEDSAPIQMLFSPGQTASINLPTSDTILSSTSNPDGSTTTTVQHPGGATTIITSYATGTGSVLNLNANGARASGFVLWGGATSTYSYDTTGAFTEFCNAVSGRITTIDVGQADGTYSETDYNSAMMVIATATGVDNGQGVATWIQTNADGSINEEDYAADGGSTYLSYDSTGNLTSKMLLNAAGYGTYSYLLNGDGSSETGWYTSVGVLTEDKSIDAQGVITDVRYNANGSVASTTITQLDGSYSIVTSGANGSTTTSFFSSPGVETQSVLVTSTGAVTTTTYAANGATTVLFMDGAQIVTTPIQNGGQAVAISGGGNSATLTLDASGNLTAGSVQALVGGASFTETNPATGIVTLYQWGTDGSFSATDQTASALAFVISANGQLTTSNYGITSTINLDGTITVVYSTAYGTQTTTQFASNDSTVLSTTVAYPDGTQITTVPTSAGGQTVTISNASANATLTTDASGNLIAGQANGNSVSFTEQDPVTGSRTTYTWIGNGLFTVAPQNAGMATLSIGAAGALITATGSAQTHNLISRTLWSNGTLTITQSSAYSTQTTTQYASDGHTVASKSVAYSDGTVVLTAPAAGGGQVLTVTDTQGDSATLNISANGLLTAGSVNLHQSLASGASYQVSEQDPATGIVTAYRWSAGGAFSATPQVSTSPTFSIGADGSFTTLANNPDGTQTTSHIYATGSATSTATDGSWSATVYNSNGTVTNTLTPGTFTQTQYLNGTTITITHSNGGGTVYPSVENNEVVTAVNSSGAIAGYYSATGSASTYPFYQASTNATPITISTPGDGSKIYAMNTTGQVAGEITEAGGYQAAFRTAAGGGSVTTFGTANGIDSYSYAINDSGVVGGEILLASGQSQAFLSTTHGGLLVGLGGTSPTDSTAVASVNNQGQALLIDKTTGVAYEYSGGTLSPITNLFTANVWNYGVTTELTQNADGSSTFNTLLPNGSTSILTSSTNGTSSVTDATVGGGLIHTASRSNGGQTIEEFYGTSGASMLTHQTSGLSSGVSDNPFIQGIGAETYLFNLGEGLDTISASGSHAGLAEVDFSAALMGHQLTAQRSGSDLSIADGIGDTLTFTNWFGGVNQTALRLPNGQLVSAATINGHLPTAGSFQLFGG